MAVTLAMIGSLTGCGSSTPTRGELVSSLERSGMAKDEAECAADAVLADLSDEQVALLVERGPGGAPVDDPDSTDDAADKVRAALGKCRAEAEAATTTTSKPAS